MKVVKKADIVLGAVLLFFGGILSILIFLSAAAGGEAEISQAGAVLGVYSLSEDRVIDIEGAGKFTGLSNRLELKDGKAKMIYADCPDQYCVKHRAVDVSNETIVCLPNKIVVTIRAGRESEVDAVTN